MNRRAEAGAGLWHGGANDEAGAYMIEFDDSVLVIAKPSLYDQCRGFAGIGMPHCRV